MEGIHQEISAWLDQKEVDFGFMSYDPHTSYDWIPLALSLIHIYAVAKRNRELITT